MCLYVKGGEEVLVAIEDLREVFDEERFSIYSGLPFGEGFKAKPTYQELRNSETDFFYGFSAWDVWSSCPFHKKARHIYNIKNCKRRGP